MTKMPARVQLSAAASGTVGTAAADMIGENQNRRYLRVHNASSTNKIAVRPDDGTDPAINGAGSITIGTEETMEFAGLCIPLNAFRIIAAGASTPYTVWEV